MLMASFWYYGPFSGSKLLATVSTSTYYVFLYKGQLSVATSTFYSQKRELTCEMEIGIDTI